MVATYTQQSVMILIQGKPKRESQINFLGEIDEDHLDPKFDLTSPKLLGFHVLHIVQSPLGLVLVVLVQVWVKHMMIEYLGP